jgi:hypothetical protein
LVTDQPKNLVTHSQSSDTKILGLQKNGGFDGLYQATHDSHDLGVPLTRVVFRKLSVASKTGSVPFSLRMSRMTLVLMMFTQIQGATNCKRIFDSSTRTLAP